ncbi:PPE domain-containing protein [Streptomyces phaeofaciens JCM 4814]|uniref:AG2 protein n=1 Tax=Streptomyces phaeofaciens TaxID=68254 RepID=A0A918HIQ0_9ACTN|nr:hypothetical protein [Streptomyces phaeofaciens]GGT66737.1 hypothetical protein GCM10010226_50530 [Streptomyces phaeofaciens]
MDLDALRTADFGLLDDAVEDWSTMVGDLETLTDAAEKGLRGAANAANWAGYNATVSKEFIGKTSGEFGDAHSQASSIHKILRDTRDELKKFKGQLTDAIERGRQQNLTVIGYEGGFTVTTNVPPEGRATQDQENKSKITALRDELQKILDQATESDSSAGTVLTAIADRSRLGFSDVDYADRDEAADALKKADELAEIVKKNPEDLTTAEFDRLNAGLKKYGNDPLFAERFATDLGPQKTLEFWTGVTSPYTNSDVFRSRLDQLDDMQRNLGLTLAAASQSDSAAMTEWKNNVIDLGEKRIGSSSGPMGFQVMSNLMRVGDYDDAFLNRYGTELMATERKLTGNGAHPNLAWSFGGAAGATQYLNRIGEDSGADPLTGFLRGLSNSPDAATQFFNQEYVSKDNPDNPFERDSDDANTYKGKVTLSNFQYLFEERDWPQEMDSHGDDLYTGQNNLALALEAATTGHPAGELPTVDTPAHNREQAKLFESLVSSISDDPGRLTDHGYMSDSIGQITSEYLPDMNRAMTDVPRVDSHGIETDKWRDVEKLYPVAGSEAELQHNDVTKLLFAVGQNEEGYAAVEVSQKAYMGKLMDYHLDPSLPEAERVSDDHKLVIEQIASRSGEVSGTLNLGAREAIGSEASDKDKEYEHSVAQRKNWISGGVGTAVGVGTSFIATPWVGALAGGAAGTATSVIMESVFQDAEGHALENAQKTGGQFWADGQGRNQAIAEDGARAAAEKYKSMDVGDAGMTAREAAKQGYLNAQAIVNGGAPGSNTAF